MSQRLRAVTVVLFASVLILMPLQGAWALITGGEGNSPIEDPGWPEGAAEIFNHPGRIAYWEGPPFGGGQWHSECRGDAEALNSVLEKFAALDVQPKRLLVHDGVGQSFWLNPNREDAKRAAAEIDWAFTVWEPASWQRLQTLPADLRPTDRHEAEHGPPTQIDVYTGGNIRWADVRVPEGIEVLDKRLEAHGFTPEDGNVLVGRIVDLETEQPIQGRMRLERIEPQPGGGYRYTDVTETAADEQGRWTLTMAPAGWHRVIAEAEEFVPRIAGYVRLSDQPRWYSFEAALARPASVSGAVTDEEGKPLAEVEVRLVSTLTRDGRRYETPHEYSTRTGAEGRFQLEQVPVGSASVQLRKSGYYHPGLRPSVSVPAEGLTFNMRHGAALRVTVDFDGKKRSDEYLVHVEPEGGAVVGSWGGSGRINEQNRIYFSEVPPGRYVVHGSPNPSSANQQTERVTVELRAGETAELTLTAR